MGSINLVIWLRALRVFIRSGNAVGRAAIALDASRTYRPNFMRAAYETGLLSALRVPRTRDELVSLLDAQRPMLLDALLAEGLANRELSLRGGNYRLRGRRARALVGPSGDAFAAMLEESISYHGDVYGRLPETLRGAPLGRHLESAGEMIARSSRTLEPFTDVVLRWAIRRSGPQTMLDVGTGSGIYLRLASEAAPGLRGVGVEVQPAVADLARKNVAEWGLSDRIEILQADILDAPAGVAGPFDLVTLLHNVYYFRDDERLRLFRLLRERTAAGGAVVIVTYAKGKTAVATHFDVVLQGTEGNTPLPTEEELRKQLEECGFAVLRVLRPLPHEPLVGIVAQPGLGGVDEREAL